MEQNINYLQDIKKEFFKFRNGIIADALKGIYNENKLIFGLNVAQFIELSSKYPKDFDLSKELWKDKKCRESRLLALYLFPIEQIDKSFAEFLISDLDSREEAEFLSFKILKKLDYANELYNEKKDSFKEDSIQGYCIEMLGKNLQINNS